MRAIDDRRHAATVVEWAPFLLRAEADEPALGAAGSCAGRAARSALMRCDAADADGMLHPHRVRLRGGRRCVSPGRRRRTGRGR